MLNSLTCLEVLANCIIRNRKSLTTHNKECNIGEKNAGNFSQTCCLVNRRRHRRRSNCWRIHQFKMYRQTKSVMPSDWRTELMLRFQHKPSSINLVKSNAELQPMVPMESIYTRFVEHRHENAEKFPDLTFDDGERDD